MKKSPAHRNYETTSDHEGFPEFYPPVDFIQFLEEASQHVLHETNTPPSSSPPPEDHEPTQKRRILVQQVGVEDDDDDHDERKSKKWTWKTSLIKWWKGYKKKTTKKKSNNNNNGARFVEPEPEPPFAASSGAHRHRHRRVSRSNYSGPIYGSGRKVVYNSSRRPSSGPLACLFSPTKREAEHEIPYTRLDQLTNDPPGDRKADGPLYKVT